MVSYAPGLPDGILVHQKFSIWEYFGGLGMENVGMFYGH
jgi:hypothetical protein